MVYGMKTPGAQALTQDEVLGKLPASDHYLRVLVETAINEIGVKKLIPLAEGYRFFATSQTGSLFQPDIKFQRVKFYPTKP